MGNNRVSADFLKLCQSIYFHLTLFIRILIWLFAISYISIYVINRNSILFIQDAYTELNHQKEHNLTVQSKQMYNNCWVCLQLSIISK